MDNECIRKHYDTRKENVAGSEINNERGKPYMQVKNTWFNEQRNHGKE